MIIALVTDRHRLRARGDEALRALVRQARAAAEAGIDILQIREPDLPAATLVALVRDIVGVTRGSRTKVVVNERLDVALTAGADGVHLRASSIDIASARRLAPPPFIIGRSIHSLDEARAAEDAEYLVAGTVWPSQSKSAHHQLLGLEGLARVVKAVRTPVLAIGGVSLERIAAVAASGAAGIAAIGLFVGEESWIEGPVSLRDVVTNTRAAFDTSGSGS